MGALITLAVANVSSARWSAQGVPVSGQTQHPSRPETRAAAASTTPCNAGAVTGDPYQSNKIISFPGPAGSAPGRGGLPHLSKTTPRIEFRHG